MDSIRMSYAVREQLRALALVASVLEQVGTVSEALKDGGAVPAEGWVEARFRLHCAHSGLRNLTLQAVGVEQEPDGRMLLPPKIFRQWVREEDQFRSRVYEALPDGDLDARSWLNCVLAAVDTAIAGMPEEPSWRSEGWRCLVDALRGLYAVYDPDLVALDAMRDGVGWAEALRA